MKNSTDPAAELIQQTAYLTTLTAPELVLYLSENLPVTRYKSLAAISDTTESTLIQTIARTAIKCLQNDKPFSLTIEMAKHKTILIINNRRKRYVRRIWKAQPLFALELVRLKYPDYTEQMLLNDLKLAKKYLRRRKFVKKPSEMGLRISQVRTLNSMLRHLDPDSADKTCNKIAGHLNGLKAKSPISLPVHYGGKIVHYDFPWNEREDNIKAFIALSKRVSSFQQLDDKWNSHKQSGR